MKYACIKTQVCVFLHSSLSLGNFPSLIILSVGILLLTSTLVVDLTSVPVPCMKTTLPYPQSGR